LEAVLRHSGAHDEVAAIRRLVATREAVAAAGPEAQSEIAAIGAYVLPELEHYGEIIAAIDRPLAGLMVRGEGEGFTARIGELMELWAMSEECKDFHRYLARAFEHKRCFLKLEWARRGNAVERQIALYYRRRPRIHEALKILARFAGTRLPTDAFRELGCLLGKDTVHFVAFTARPNAPLWYKFYFSQYLTPESYDSVKLRLRRALRRFAVPAAAEERWSAYHDVLAPRHRVETIFVSVAVSEDGHDPSIKIDYPDVPPAVGSGLLDEAAMTRAESTLRALCDGAGRTALSYLGVRLGSSSEPILKGYADFL
jgi:hypothetical protein